MPLVAQSANLQRNGFQVSTQPPFVALRYDGTRLDVPLITGRTVKAEISPLPNAKQAKPFFRGSVVSVYADEL